MVSHTVLETLVNFSQKIILFVEHINNLFLSKLDVVISLFDRKGCSIVTNSKVSG